MSDQSPPPARAGTPTETPRTDAMARHIDEWEGEIPPVRYVVPDYFARQLERELSALTSANAVADRLREETIATVLEELKQLEDYFALGEMLFAVSNRFPFSVKLVKDAIDRLSALLAQPVTPGTPTDGAHAGEK